VLCSLLWVTLLGQGVGLGDPQRAPQPPPCWDSVILWRGAAIQGLSSRRSPPTRPRPRQGWPCPRGAVPGDRQGPRRGDGVRCQLAQEPREAGWATQGAVGARGEARGAVTPTSGSAWLGSGIAAGDCHDNTAVTNPLPDGITPTPACSAPGLLWRPAPVGTAAAPALGDVVAPLCPPRGSGGLCGAPSPPQLSARGVSPRPQRKVLAAPIRPRTGCPVSRPSAGPPVSPGGCAGRCAAVRARVTAPEISWSPGWSAGRRQDDARARYGSASADEPNPMKPWRRLRGDLRTEVRAIAPAGTPGTPSLLRAAG